MGTNGEEIFKNFLLENQAALIYFNIGTGKLRTTLGHVTYESDMWEIRFKQKRQNFSVAWYCHEGREAGSNGTSCGKAAAEPAWAREGGGLLHCPVSLLWLWPGGPLCFCGQRTETFPQPPLHCCNSITV